jgi:hypothetical protein
LREIAPAGAYLRSPDILDCDSIRLIILTLTGEGPPEPPEPEVEWTFLSPSAEMRPRKRRGKFRLGTDSLIADSKGRTTISVEDYAFAMIDELEKPKHIWQRLTVGY